VTRGGAGAAVKAGGARPREVRLIGGTFKRSKLPVADRPGLRPTPDRVRETLFNWLGQDLRGWRVLDAFAGSGALGFEAASRGAAEVVLLDSDRALVESLRASAVRLKAGAVHVEHADALAWMRTGSRESFDLVLLDPPFSAGLMPTAFRLAAGLVSVTGYIYAEDERLLEESHGTPGFVLQRCLKAGRVRAQLFRRSADGCRSAV
jgi:16S rRNA (guanine(966)-N(2))-methyltransferase RsmD